MLRRLKNSKRSNVLVQGSFLTTTRLVVGSDPNLSTLGILSMLKYLITAPYEMLGSAVKQATISDAF